MYDHSARSSVIDALKHGFFCLRCEGRARAEALNFIETYLAFDPPGPTGSDIEVVVSRVREVLDRLQVDQLDEDSARLELNAVLKHFSQIDWWGSREDLFSSSAAFPQRVRTWFRENRGDSNPSDHAISDEETQSFLDSIQEYGL
jgi:hypothetical protein